MRKGSVAGACQFFLPLLWTALAGCGGAMIPNTEIPDTDENRDVVTFVERYRRAVEDRDIGALMTMASPRYFENAGTPQGEDDYNLAGLQRLFSQFPDRVREVRYDIRYRRIRRSGARVYVQYTFNTSFQLSTPGGDRWYRRIGDNELELERVGNRWRIIAGM